MNDAGDRKGYESRVGKEGRKSAPAQHGRPKKTVLLTPIRVTPAQGAVIRSCRLPVVFSDKMAGDRVRVLLEGARIDNHPGVADLEGLADIAVAICDGDQPVSAVRHPIGVIDVAVLVRILRTMPLGDANGRGTADIGFTNTVRSAACKHCAQHKGK